MSAAILINADPAHRRRAAEYLDGATAEEIYTRRTRPGEPLRHGCFVATVRMRVPYDTTETEFNVQLPLAPLDAGTCAPRCVGSSGQVLPIGGGDNVRHWHTVQIAPDPEDTPLDLLDDVAVLLEARAPSTDDAPVIEITRTLPSRHGDDEGSYRVAVRGAGWRLEATETNFAAAVVMLRSLTLDAGGGK